jgi:hypothetical protein
MIILALIEQKKICCISCMACYRVKQQKKLLVIVSISYLITNRTNTQKQGVYNLDHNK